MSYSLNSIGLNKTIIQVDNANSIMTVSGIGYSGDRPAWLNVNVKYGSSPLYSNGYNGERDITYLDSGSSLNFRLTKSGTISGSNPYILGGYYPGGSYFVTQSANDNDPTQTGLIESNQVYFLTYSEPRMKSGSNGSLANPNQFNANAANFVMTINKISEPTHPGQEDFMLMYRRYYYNPGAVYNGEGTVGSVAGLTKNKVQEQETISYAMSYDPYKTGNYVKPKANITYGDYIWNVSGYNTAKSIANPDQFDNTTIRLEYFVRSRCINGDTTYSPVETSDKFNYYLKVYYRPRIAISPSNVRFYQNSNGGAYIGTGSTSTAHILNEPAKLTGVNIAWDYNTDQIRAGYTQGYRIRLYNSSGALINTYYTTQKNYTIPKKDIPKFVSTQIDITPYYTHDQGDPTQYWYQGDVADSGTVARMPFVQMIAQLDPTDIEYPVSGSNWINNEFRVCFRLPNDDDYEEIGDSYRYDNIELEVNGKVFTLKNSTGSTSGAMVKPRNV